MEAVLRAFEPDETVMEVVDGKEVDLIDYLPELDIDRSNGTPQRPDHFEELGDR